MSNRDRIVVGGLACVVAIAGFWFLALKPKRAEATAAQARAAAAQTQLQAATEALATATTAKASFDTDYATIARLGKAVPDDDDSASLVYQLETAARNAGIDFRSLTVGGVAAPAPAAATPADTSKSGSTTSSTPTPAPAAATPAATTLPPGVIAGTNGMNQLPFTFVFDGDYFNLTKLLELLKSFTTAKDDTVTVRGRLMTVQAVNLEQSRNGFPDVKATVTATAYLSATPITLPGNAPVPAPQSGTTPSTTAPATQAASVAKSVPTATAIPGAVR